MAIHSSILGWEILWTEEPDGLQSMWLQRVRHDWRDLACTYIHIYRVRLFATPWTVAYQAPLSMGFSRQEYWSGLPFEQQDIIKGIKGKNYNQDQST